jgi:hypothetical protein
MVQVLKKNFRLKVSIFTFILSIIGCGNINSSALINTMQSQGSLKLNETPATQKNDIPASQEGKPLIQDSEKESSTAVPAAAPQEQTKKPSQRILEDGSLKPSIYFFPVINEDIQKCDSDNMKAIRNASGSRLAIVCRKTWDACNLEGSCAVIQNSVRRAFNVSDTVMGENRFMELTENDCPYGFGVKNYCLDPFYTIAADKDYYKAGDVIYIPAVVGLKLPDGILHDGYFIIRDHGKDISGRGRFDFYTGFLAWHNNENPFKKIGFDDSKTRVPYMKISGEQAALVLKQRAFPKLPLNKK